MAALLALMLQTILLLPLGYAYWRAWEHLGWVAAMYSAGILGTIAFVTFVTPGPASLTLPSDAMTSVSGGISMPRGTAEAVGSGSRSGATSQCAEAIRMSEQIDLFDPPLDGVLPVNAQIWEQLPPASREGLLQCISNELAGGKRLRAEPR